MITGDHIVTAGAISATVGILCDGDEAVTGAQLGCNERAGVDGTC